MALCFVCNERLYSQRTRVCSSITLHSNTPYPEKIAGMLGEEFVVIVTPKDQMCMKCTSLLNHLDKSEYNAKLFKNAMVSNIQKRYGILPPDQAVKGVEIVNRHLMTGEQLEQGQHKISNGLTVGASPTATTAAVVTPIETTLKLLKTQLQKQQQQQQQQQESTKKRKLYRCGSCGFQSKELEHFQFHMRTHTNKKEPGKLILNQAAAKTLTLQQKKLLYGCQVCTETFDSRINCLDHIKIEHNQLTTSTSNEAREIEGYADVKEETENSQKNTTVKESISVKKREQEKEKEKAKKKKNKKKPLK